MAMYDENIVLCAASAYEKKFYFNESFFGLPAGVKDELKIMCVLFTEEAGGILTLEFDEAGELLLSSRADEGDLLYDEISSGLLIKRMRAEKRELLASLELFYRTFFLNED